MGLELFRGWYRDDSGDLLDGNFDTTGDTLIALYVLLTGDNYPDILYPALDKSPASILFFISFLLISVYFILSFVLAILFEAYKEERKVILYIQFK